MDRRLPDHLRVMLSKKMSGLLRHYGPRYGLNVEPDGWVKLTDLVGAIRLMPGFDWVTVEDVVEVVMLDEKGRYEVKGGMIRARYGHSLMVDIEYERVPWSRLPGTLYHGTIIEKIAPILKSGLKPMRRRFVHLSPTTEEAYNVGRRHGPRVVVLEVNVGCLRKSGIQVYKATDQVYLVDWVPPECISVTHHNYSTRWLR